jgi:hypothetical protein
LLVSPQNMSLSVLQATSSDLGPFKNRHNLA